MITVPGSCWKRKLKYCLYHNAIISGPLISKQRLIQINNLRTLPNFSRRHLLSLLLIQPNQNTLRNTFQVEGQFLMELDFQTTFKIYRFSLTIFPKIKFRSCSNSLMLKCQSIFNQFWKKLHFKCFLIKTKLNPKNKR